MQTTQNQYQASRRRTRAAVIVAIVLAVAGIVHGQQYTLSPAPFQYVLSTAGAIVPNGCVWTYAAGTTNAIATYADTSGTPNGNPIIADTFGRFVAYLLPGTNYKFQYEATPCSGPSTHGATIKTQDTIQGVPASAANVDIVGTAGEALAAGQCAYLSDGSGSKTQGQWYKCDSTNTYSSTLPVAGMPVANISIATTGTFRLAGYVTGLSSLTVGSEYFASTSGSLTSSAPANRRLLGQADTTTTLILAGNPSLMTAAASGTANGSTFLSGAQTWALPGGNGVVQGRLSLTSGTPVTTADVTGAGTVYYTPTSAGNQISLYDGSATWNIRAFAELSISLASGFVAFQGYDVFAYDNAGVVALETLEWANTTITMTIAAPGVVTWTAHGLTTCASTVSFTNTGGALPTGVTANTQYWITTVDANSFKLSTSASNCAAGTFITTSGTQSGTHTGHNPQARQTALVRQDGVLVKSGATTRRFLGSFFTTAATTTEDSVTKRFLSNYYNQRPRTFLRRYPTTSWAYTLATVRSADFANVGDANRVETFVAYPEVRLYLVLHVTVQPSVSSNCVAGFGEDSTNAFSTNNVGGASSTASYNMIGTSLDIYPTAGRHAYQGVEYSTATGTTTWFGTGGFAVANQASGIAGWIEG